MDRRPEPVDEHHYPQPRIPGNAQISDVRVQAHLCENGLWTVRISGQVRGQYRSEFYQDIEFLRIAVGQLLAGFGQRHRGSPL